MGPYNEKNLSISENQVLFRIFMTIQIMHNFDFWNLLTLDTCPTPPSRICVRFCQILGPPSPFGCWHDMWPFPKVYLNPISWAYLQKERQWHIMGKRLSWSLDYGWSKIFLELPWVDLRWRAKIQTISQGLKFAHFYLEVTERRMLGSS